MTFEEFEKLPIKMQHILLLAINVRNALEDFHCKYISDEQMPELNRAVRDGLMEGLTVIENLKDIKKQSKKRQNQISHAMWWYITMIPEEWELPEEFDWEKSLGMVQEYLDVSKGRG